VAVFLAVSLEDWGIGVLYIRPRNCGLSLVAVIGVIPVR